MTVITPIKPHRYPRLRLAFALSWKFPQLMSTLRALSFINAARWSIVHEVPYNGPPQRKEKLRYRYLIFLSNYNGYWRQYIDAFANILPDRMVRIWGNTYGFPPRAEPGPLKRHIRKNEYDESHYYCAYPDGSATIILDALALQERFTSFQAQVEGRNPEQLQAAFTEFVTENQRRL